MKKDRTKKVANWLYSDDFELDGSACLLPHLWWSAATYGRSLSRAYSKLGLLEDETTSGVALSFYWHFLGSLYGTAYELALKMLLISLDDPDGARIGFPKKHDLCGLWSLVPSEVQSEITQEAKSRGFGGSISDWFLEHQHFLTVEDRYPERTRGSSSKLRTTHRLLLPRGLSGDLIGQMEVIFQSIMQAMRHRYLSDEQADLPNEELDKVRAVVNEFEGLQQTRNRWSHLWGQPVVRPPTGTPIESQTFEGGTVVGYALDVTLLEQGQEARPRVVPRLWWVPASLEGLKEFDDADAFNTFVNQQVEEGSSP